MRYRFLYNAMCQIHLYWKLVRLECFLLRCYLLVRYNIGCVCVCMCIVHVLKVWWVNLYLYYNSVGFVWCVYTFALHFYLCVCAFCGTRNLCQSCSSLPSFDFILMLRDEHSHAIHADCRERGEWEKKKSLLHTVLLSGTHAIVIHIKQYTCIIHTLLTHNRYFSHFMKFMSDY